MRKTAFLFLLFFQCVLFAQQTQKIVVKKEQPAVYAPREIFFETTAAYYPSGLRALADFLKANTRLPDAVKNGQINGIVYVKFIISDSGTVEKPQVLKGITGCAPCTTEALRVVSLLRFMPAVEDNKFVSSERNLPVRFKTGDN